MDIVIIAEIQIISLYLQRPLNLNEIRRIVKHNIRRFNVLFLTYSKLQFRRRSQARAIKDAHCFVYNTIGFSHYM